tara:strand:- start:7971 stop:10571 length:2601 start_codon:yes stop_codon:yes gene_type:complete
MKKITLTLLFLAITTLVHAQIEEAIGRFPFDETISYDSSIPSPAEYLGYRLGEQYTFHYQIMDYFRLLGERSDKITVHEYARTYEGRDLNYAVITSAENQNKIEEIRNANLKIANNPENATIGEQPVVVWMSYNVHGNEPSSSEAAMQAAYRLVAASDPDTEKWLDNAVVIIDPMINPDGRDRYIYWYKSSQANILNTNVEDLEHDEIWPGGRTNHYWFDLNRDWVWLVHPESRGRITAYQQWMPQVHMDFHEQGANNNYFVMPGTTPRNHELPKDYDLYADKFGRGVIAEFDKANVNYATREAFDFFYPGYGSSYPSVMGGIGMLAEQGGHSRGGRALETDDGYVLTLRQRIFDHYTNSISIVKTAVSNREGLLTYFKEARSQATQKGNTKAYILPDNSDNYTYEVINMLMSHGVKVERAENNFTIKKAYDYWDGKAASKSFRKGAFIIKTDQPAHLFINTLFRRQLEIRDSVMYDMATWSVPLAYNLEAAWSTSEPGVKTTVLNRPLETPSGLENGTAGYAYVIDWKQKNAPKALSMLWEMGYNVRSAMKPFTSNGITYSRGSLITLIGRNYDKRDEIHTDFMKVADEAGVKIVAFNTGRMDDGIDLGSMDSEPVQQPKVALMIDSPFSSYTAGQLWFLFDQWTEFGISRVRADNFNRMDINEYDVIVMPGAWNLNGLLNDSGKDRLKTWIRNGGVLVATEGTAAWMTKDRAGISGVELFSEDAEDKKDKEIPAAAYTRYEDLADSSGLKRIPGSAFKAVIDNSNPLAFGMPETLYSLKFSSDAFVPSTSAQTVGYYMKDADEVLASGYASPENKRNAAGNAFAVVESMGRGKVVLLLDNTQYRMFWVGPARMVQNAVMLLPGM